MNAHGIEILHGADGYNIALAVTDYLEFYLFPAAYALFDKHLCDRRKPQAVCGNVPKLVLVVGDTAACSAESKGGTDDYGVTYFLGKVNGVLNGLNDF